MLSRREWLGLTLGTGAAVALDQGQPPARVLAALQSQKLITRAIPSSGERIPIVGLGSSATCSRVARSADVGALREVMRTLVEQGGAVFDTAPSYGASEE